MSRINRRDFVRGVAASGVAAWAMPWSRSAHAGDVNDEIRVCVVGLNGRGQNHLDEYLRMPGVTVASLVDVDARVLEKSAKKVAGKGGANPETFSDIRKALEDKNIDAVSIATPNHWHALMTIWACEAGKHVYVEKPSSHNVHEGRIAVEAARKHDRIVQHGTQNRSSGNWAKQVAAIASGKYGKLLVSKGYCYKRRNSIGTRGPMNPPPNVDFNLWLGPAPEQPFHLNLVHYNWHWFWDFGNGDIGNQGVHQMDIARWAIPGATLPKSVISIGGRFGYKDQGETPNTQIALMDFGESKLLFEVRGLPTEGKIDNEFFLEEGRISKGQFFPKGSDKGEPLADVDFRVQPGGPFGNFIRAVRENKRELLNADIIEGHFSSACGHLANISYRLGQEVPFSSQTKAFGDDKAAYEAFAAMEEHLGKDNGLALDNLQYRLGRTLTIDVEKETILDDSQATALLTREYRAPFIVPQSIV